MVDLLDLQKSFILAHLKPGDTAVDYTMGNGHDTAFLSETVGENGQVFAFDIQLAAMESTRKNLEKWGTPANYTLFNVSHHRAAEFVTGKVRAGMFNLGYLPGSDKQITTMRATTMPAIEAAIDLLDHGGVLMVAVYPGHAEGEAEGKMLLDYFATPDRTKICCTLIRILNSPTSPFFIVIEKK